MAEQPNLIVQVPRGSAVERQLHAGRPPVLTADDVLVQTGPTDAEGVLEEMAGDIVLSLPSPEELERHADDLARVLDEAGTGTAPLVVLIQAAEELTDGEASQ